MKGKLIVVALILLILYLLPSYPEPIVMRNFLSESERRHIISEATNKLETSTISHNKMVDENIRKSETAWLDKDDKVVRNVINRCLKQTDRPIGNCEKLQVLKYKPGGHYSPHQDCFNNDKNPRMYTFILALNDDYEGGETVFPNIGKRYKLKTGDALFFDTIDNYELMTSKALHGGEPVKNGEKWICNLWVRKYPYA